MNPLNSSGDHTNQGEQNAESVSTTRADNGPSQSDYYIQNLQSAIFATNRVDDFTTFGLQQTRMSDQVATRLSTIVDCDLYQHSVSAHELGPFVYNCFVTDVVQPGASSTFLDINDGACNFPSSHQQQYSDHPAYGFHGNFSEINFNNTSLPTLNDKDSQSSIATLTAPLIQTDSLHPSFEACRYEGRNLRLESTLPNSDNSSLAPNCLIALANSEQYHIPTGFQINTDQNEGRPPRRGRKVCSQKYTSFPFTLYLLLEEARDKGYEQIIRWQSHGRGFRVDDPIQFVSLVMPHYFLQTRFSSFQRQLALYGFMRITMSGEDRGSYRHDQFVRGFPQLCSNIKRTPIKGRKDPLAQQPIAMVAATQKFTRNLATQKTESIYDPRSSPSKPKSTHSAPNAAASVDMNYQTHIDALRWSNHLKPSQQQHRIVTGSASLNTPASNMSFNSTILVPMAIEQLSPGKSLTLDLPHVNRTSLEDTENSSNFEKRNRSDQYEASNQEREILFYDEDDETDDYIMVHFLSDVNFDTDI